MVWYGMVSLKLKLSSLLDYIHIYSIYIHTTTKMLAAIVAKR